MSSFNTSEFKKLKEKYYKKLEDSGFKDIEDENEWMRGSLEDLTQRNGFKTTPIKNAIENYYIWAYQHAMHSKFRSRLEKRIWVAHAEGKSSRAIAKIVNVDQSWVCQKIKQTRIWLLLDYQKKTPQNSLSE